MRGIGVIDLAGGLGVVLPMLTGILPGLTVVAAIGCVLLQLCAMAFHLSRGERSAVPVNIVLLAMAAFIALGAVAPAVMTFEREATRPGALTYRPPRGRGA